MKVTTEVEQQAQSVLIWILLIGDIDQCVRPVERIGPASGAGYDEGLRLVEAT